MKKIILAAVMMVIVLSTGKSFGQTSGTANLSITLSNVMSITITDPPAVNFDSETKYTNGITNLATNNITVVSSGPYVVKAVAGTITGTSLLDAGSVLITAANGAGGGNFDGITSYPADVVLPASGSTEATIISSTETTWVGAVAATKFDVTYKIGTGGQYAGKPFAVNGIPVVYTVALP